MNKVVTIHLNGKAYQLEEAAYDALRAYLAQAESALAGDPDKAEILRDLEQAIGEKCDRFLSGHKDVLTASEIGTVIAEMGPVGAAESTARAADDTAHGPKRLYLIREGSMIAGVCTGLGAYFGVDPNIVRLIFAGLTMLTGGGWILVYFALATLVPYADTAEEKAAAHGLPFNAQELINRAKETYTRFTEDDGWRAHRHEWKRQWKDWKRREKESRRAWRREQRAWRGPAAPILGLIAGALGLLWIFALISLVTTGMLFGWMLPAGIPLWLAIVLLFFFYHAVTGPLQVARHPYGSGWFAIADAATVAFLLIAFGFIYVHYPAVHDAVSSVLSRIASALHLR